MLKSFTELERFGVKDVNILPIFLSCQLGGISGQDIKLRRMSDFE